MKCGLLVISDRKEIRYPEETEKYPGRIQDTRNYSLKRNCEKLFHPYGCGTGRKNLLKKRGKSRLLHFVKKTGRAFGYYAIRMILRTSEHVGKWQGLMEVKTTMEIKPCEIGTPVRLPHDMGYGGQIVFNYRHQWIDIDGKEYCLNCGLTPQQVGYGKRRMTRNHKGNSKITSTS